MDARVQEAVRRLEAAGYVCRVYDFDNAGVSINVLTPVAGTEFADLVVRWEGERESTVKDFLAQFERYL